MKFPQHEKMSWEISCNKDRYLLYENQSYVDDAFHAQHVFFESLETSLDLHTASPTPAQSLFHRLCFSATRRRRRQRVAGGKRDACPFLVTGPCSCTSGPFDAPLRLARVKSTDKLRFPSKKERARVDYHLSNEVCRNLR